MPHAVRHPTGIQPRLVNGCGLRCRLRRLERSSVKFASGDRPLHAVGQVNCSVSLLQLSEARAKYRRALVR